MKQPFPHALVRAALAGLAALLAAGCAAPPHTDAAPPAAPSAGARPTANGTYSYTLANGFTVLVKPDHRAPTAVQMVMVRVGSLDEVDGRSGLAHLLEHMMFKGTPSVPPGEFSRRVAALGGRENAFTSRDLTGFYQQIPANRLEDVMKLESDRFAHNSWPDDEFRHELEVVKEERRMRTEDSPRAQLYEVLNAAIFNASGYRRPTVGWMADLDSMKPEDARDFFHQWYVPANAVLVVAGDVDPDQVRRLAERYYGAIPARAVPERKPRTELPQRGIRRVELKAQAEQAYVALAFRVPSLGDIERPNDDALALTVLASVLDGYPGARLERALVRGQARVADEADADNGLMGRGPQIFVLDGVPAEGQTTEQLEAALRAQVALVAKSGVSESELARVKTQWVANETYKLDSVMGQAREIGNYWIQGLPPDAGEKLIARLKAVTAAQVQSVAQRYFGDDELTVATLRPQPIDPNRKPRVPQGRPSGETR